ncbi:LysR family transcriptional regulator [Pseudoalteromonas sp. JBTF-M23]|uniref:LysR family transcriptional regulator n=1 Tax=Pseudoalteromonas caenipelagi TaxID=2726988 RepID=A0A849VG63_9GAMM|nr:LysR substrate-binding domain-containing protein [Pseudoalteromonas caenipelagi]NOU50701.1 LysR family transcriptional regulator [Pseudoalteromonas caenipelagi]
MNRLPPLKSMQAFEAAARNMSFSRAAAELCVSQSAISHQVKSLEQFLGKKLLERNSSHVRLTLDGHTYFTVIKDCFKRMHSITDHLLNKSPYKLKVMAQSSIAVEWLAPKISGFNESYPDIEVSLSMASHGETFEPSDFDIIVGTWPVPPNFITRKTRDERWFPVCSAELIDDKSTLTIEDILNLPLVSSEMGKDWELWAQNNQVDSNSLTISMEVSHTLLAAKVALGGKYIALSTDFIVHQLVESGKLLAFKELSYVLPWGHYAIHYRLGSHAHEDIESFVNWFVDTCKD